MLAKRELLCVPLIGWTWYFLEIVFCKRKWEEDRDIVKEGLKRLADYPEYMWVSVLHVHWMAVACERDSVLLCATPVSCRISGWGNGSFGKVLATQV